MDESDALTIQDPPPQDTLMEAPPQQEQTPLPSPTMADARILDDERIRTEKASAMRTETALLAKVLPDKRGDSEELKALRDKAITTGDPQMFMDRAVSWRATAAMLGVTPDSLDDRNYELYKKQIASQMKVPVPSTDGGYRDLLSGYFQKEHAKATAFESIPAMVITNLDQEGGAGKSMGILERFNEWKALNADAVAGVPDAEALSQFSKSYQSARSEMNGQFAPLARQIVDAFGNKPMGEQEVSEVKNALTQTANADPILNALGVTSRENFVKDEDKATPIIEQLTSLSAEDRKKVYQLAGALERARNPQQTGFLASLYSMGQAFSRAADSSVIPDEQDPQKALRNRIGLELKDAAKNVVNPMLYSDKVGYESTGTFLTKVGQGVAGAGKYVAASALAGPEVGLAYMGANIVAEQQNRLLLQNPDMTPNEALAYGAAIAAPQTALMSISLRGMTGAFPSIERAIEKVASGAVSKYALNTAISGAGFTGAGVVEAIGDSVIHEIDPEWNKDSEIGRDLHRVFVNAPQDFAMAAVFSLFHAGKPVDREALNRIAEDPANLVKQGLSQEAAERVAATPPETRPETLAAELSSVTPEQKEQGIQLSEREAQKAQVLAQDPAAPKVETLPDGKIAVISPDEKGNHQPVFVTDDPQAAHQALTLALDEHAAKRAETEPTNDWTTATEEGSNQDLINLIKIDSKENQSGLDNQAVTKNFDSNFNQVESNNDSNLSDQEKAREWYQNYINENLMPTWGTTERASVSEAKSDNGRMDRDAVLEINRLMSNGDPIPKELGDKVGANGFDGYTFNEASNLFEKSLHPNETLPDTEKPFPTTREEVQAQLDDLLKKREEEAAAPAEPEQEPEFGPEAPAPEPEPPAEPNPLEEAPATTEEKTAPKAAKGKSKGKNKEADGITDFGEKIEGAKKDLWQRYEAAMQADLPSDVKDITISKHFPEPDYGKLIEGGANLERVAAMKAIRDLIPRKPANRYKLARWGELVKSLHDSLKLVVSPESQISNERLNELLGQSPAIAGKVDLYRELGYPAFLGAKDWRVDQSRDGMYFNGQKIKPGTLITTTYFKDRWMSIHSMNPDPAEAMKDVAGQIKQKVEIQQQATGGAENKGKKIAFNAYRDKETGKVFIGRKGLTSIIRIKTGFDTPKEAFRYIEDNHADLSTLWEGMKTQTTGRKDTNAERKGKPQRTGDITPDTFSEAFGFRGVQFGNYVEGSRRQTDLNHSFDALMDLSEALGLSPRALSLDGQLGMAFGARGKGKAMAHYEPDNVVINLTKAGGPGSLAHEWFHAADNYFNRLDKTGNSDWKSREFSYASDNAKPPVNMRPEVWAAFKTLRDTLAKGEFSKRAKDLDELRSKPYWGTTVEKAARAFESYIKDRLSEKGITNDYLANIDEETGAYPTKEELDGGIRQAFDGLFNAIDDTELPKLAASIKTRLNLGRVTGESGGIDPTILEDIADYGTRIFEKGMEFKGWAGRMLNDLGDSVKGVLARIWEAYKSLGNAGAIGGKADDFARRVEGQQPRGEKARAFFTPDAENGNKIPPPLTLKDKAKIAAGKIASAVRDLPADSDFKREVLKWSARSQGSTNEIERVQKSIEKSVPDAAKRDGITNWIEAGGDKNLLRERAAATVDAKLKAGYKAALNLTPEELAVAKKVQQTFSVLEGRAKKYGIDMGHRENYVPHVFEQEPQPPSGTSPKRLSEFFKFSQTRVFDSYFEGEQVTDKDGNPAPYKAQTKDIAKLLGLYMNDMNNAINSRRFVADLSKGKASDGRPILSPRGSGTTVEGEHGEGTVHLIYPDSAKEGHEDYDDKIDQPALKSWVFVGKDDMGKSILQHGDLAVHPEVAATFKNILGTSAITKWLQTKTENPFLNGGKWVADKFIKGQGIVKGTMLSFSPFHQVQEGIHALGHRVNPFTDIPKIDLRDPKQADAAAHGLMIAHDRLSQSLFMEGVGSNNSNLITMGLRKIGWGLTTEAADRVDAYQHWLFSQYIPGLKLKTYEHILERNMERYKDDLASGAASEWQVKVLSAKQSNAAYGHLNYTEMGHNPTIRHAMQIALLAPDFLEARSRFVGQSLKALAGAKVGSEQLQALAFLAATQFVAATIQKVLTNDDAEFDHPFEMRFGNKYYGMRSVPEDIYKLFGNPQGFIGGRISPIFGRFFQEGVFGVNYRGERTSAGDAIADIMAGIVPLPMQTLTRQWTTGGKVNPISPLEQILSATGIQVHRYSPITKVYPLAHDWVKKNHPEDEQKGTYPVSKYQQLRYALEDNDTEAAKKEIDRLVEGGMKKADIGKGFKSSVNHPFTGSKDHDHEFYKSLDEDDKQRFDAAVERRKEILRRFQSLGH